MGMQGNPIAVPLNIVEADGQTVDEVTIIVPMGVSLSAGTPDAGGTFWTFMGPPPADLTFTSSFTGKFEISVSINANMLGGTSVNQKVMVT